AFDNRDTKSEKIASSDVNISKLFKTPRPKTIPPKSDKSTFREYNAKAIARRDGRSESAEFSILSQSKFVC
ncbi:MAG: hypothetical protein KAS26_01200, partial [Sulfurimonas sp.]|nr:hypothetical protein [Sulfurimonas sp.]